MLKIKRLPHGEGLPLPAYATDGAAGLDLCAAADVAFSGPTEIPTGFAVEIPDGYEGQVRGRSGLAFKHGILAHVGTIDSDYRGEVKVMLVPTAGAILLHKGDRVAQLVISPVKRAEVQEVDELTGTARGEGGFGSTGA